LPASPMAHDGDDDITSVYSGSVLKEDERAAWEAARERARAVQGGGGVPRLGLNRSPVVQIRSAHGSPPSPSVVALVCPVLTNPSASVYVSRMDFPRAPGSRRHLLLVLTLVLSGACTSAKLVSSGRSERPAGSDPFHDLLVTADACAAPPPATIMRGQALGDLDRVERIVRRGYSGFEVLNRGGVDWNETFRRARAALNGTPEPIPVDSFRRFLIDALSLTRDGHLAFGTLAAHGESRWSSTGAHQDVFAANVVLTRAGDGWAIERSRDPAASPGSLVLDCAGQALGDLLRLTITGDPPEPAWLLARMSTAPPEPLRCRIRIGDTIRETPLSLHRLRASEPGPLAAAPALVPGTDRRPASRRRER
jgi:hypothetical protein